LGRKRSRSVAEFQKEQGTVIVQSPKTAKYRDMPREAIATGAADDVLFPEAIAPELRRLISVLRRSAELHRPFGAP
jgi:chemotaxis response regulator CheB